MVELNAGLELGTAPASEYVSWGVPTGVTIGILQRWEIGFDMGADFTSTSYDRTSAPSYGFDTRVLAVNTEQVQLAPHLHAEASLRFTQTQTGNSSTSASRYLAVGPDTRIRLGSRLAIRMGDSLLYFSGSEFSNVSGLRIDPALEIQASSTLGFVVGSRLLRVYAMSNGTSSDVTVSTILDAYTLNMRACIGLGRRVDLWLDLNLLSGATTTIGTQASFRIRL